MMMIPRNGDIKGNTDVEVGTNRPMAGGIVPLISGLVTIAWTWKSVLTKYS